MLAALLEAPVLLGVADNALLGMGVPVVAMQFPTSAVLQEYFGWLMYSNAALLYGAAG